MNVIEKYRLEQKTLDFGKIKIDLYHTDNLDSFFDKLDPAAFNEDERFPYFVNIWQSGYFLARYLIEEIGDKNLYNKQILELGSGTGMTGLAAGLLGAQITFTDYEEDSLKLCDTNAAANGIRSHKLLLADWRNFPDTGIKYDFIIGSDLLYENRFLLPLVETSSGLIDEGAVFLYADPCRNYHKEYLSIMEKKGYKTSFLRSYVNENKLEVRIFEIKK